MKTAPPCFEIRVALIGYVSVGKTTILNALLKDKYSEVSMKRTTAGINLFRIDSGGSGSEASMNMDQANTTQGHRTSESTFEEITSDNKVLRESNVMQEKTFDIKLDEPLFEMRKDTKLTLIDVPGINEAGISKKYKDYVLDNWHSFDRAIVVLDGRQGVNTDEQVELLKMIQIACQTEKKIPLIVLLNKIDESDDEEQQVLVKEVTKKISDMFNVPNRAKELGYIMTGKAGSPRTNRNFSPLVIAISAIHAFIYRMGSNLGFDTFKTKIDKSLVDKLGREAYGRRWKRFSTSDQMKKAYEVVQDKEQHQEGIEASQFHQFLAALSFCVGGVANQEWLIEEQITTSKKRLVPSLDFVAELKSLYNKCIRSNKPVDFVTLQFLEIQKASTEKAFECFTGPSEVHHLAKPMEELFSYCDLLKHMDIFDKNKEEIVDLAKGLVLRQVETVLEGKHWKDKLLTKYDWILILGSMLGVCHGRVFGEHFILVRILLEKKLHEYFRAAADGLVGHTNCSACKQKLVPEYNALSCTSCMVLYVDKTVLDNNICLRCRGGYGNNYYLSGGNCTGNCRWSHKLKTYPENDPLLFHFEGGKLVPSDAELFQKVIHCEIVDSPADPKHFGHLIWRFVGLLESIG